MIPYCVLQHQTCIILYIYPLYYTHSGETLEQNSPGMGHNFSSIKGSMHISVICWICSTHAHKNQ